MTDRAERAAALDEAKSRKVERLSEKRKAVERLIRAGQSNTHIKRAVRVDGVLVAQVRAELEGKP